VTGLCNHSSVSWIVISVVSFLIYDYPTLNGAIKYDELNEIKSKFCTEKSDDSSEYFLSSSRNNALRRLEGGEKTLNSNNEEKSIKSRSMLVRPHFILMQKNFSLLSVFSAEFHKEI
jgi:hypothetical protein